MGRGVALRRRYTRGVGGGCQGSEGGSLSGCAEGGVLVTGGGAGVACAGLSFAPGYHLAAFRAEVLREFLGEGRATGVA